MGMNGNKQVRAVVEIGPNYAFHLMAVARVGFDSEYADQYQSSVLPDDIAFMQKHKELITFAAGTGGDLVDILPGLPATFNLDSKQALEEYFSLLAAGTAKGNFKPFLDQYSSSFEKLQRWIGAVIDENALKPFAAYHEIIARLGEIAVRNFDSYMHDVWKLEEPKLSEVASKIDEYLKNVNRIGRWENQTGLEFKFDLYQILLCSAIKGGPDADSLGYDRVVFYHGSPIEEMCQFISHEIGTHLLIDDFRRLAGSNRFAYADLYEAMECLAHYYNTLVLKKPNLAYAHRLSSFHPVEYAEVYRGIHDLEPHLPPFELMEKGIETYQARLEAP
jgi:hypothetical protein